MKVRARSITCLGAPSAALADLTVLARILIGLGALAVAACSHESGAGALSSSASVSSTASTPTSSAPTPASASAPWVLPTPKYFPKLKTPPSNPLSAEKIALGKALFFDKRLGSHAACSDCHRPDRGWADGIALSKRASGRSNTRHTLSLNNVGYQKYWGWDGRSPTLEAQVKEDWTYQMSATPDVAAKRIAQDAGYPPMFAAAFGDESVTAKRIVHAVASFVRSIRNGDAPYDRFSNGDADAISAAAKRGWLVFRDKGGCTACHVPPLFTDHMFHNVGIGYGHEEGADAPLVGDTGRGNLTKRKRDLGAFKTPSLRSVVSSAPYFHDGSAATLEAAVDYMLSGGHPNPHLDQALTKLVLTSDQRDDLLAFIRSLDGSRP